MDHGIEEAFASALGVLAMTQILCEVRNQPRIEDALPIACGIKAAIEVEVGPSEGQPDLFGYLFQRFQALREEDHIGLIDRRHGERREAGAMVVRDRDDCLALLVFVP